MTAWAILLMLVLLALGIVFVGGLRGRWLAITAVALLMAGAINAPRHPIPNARAAARQSTSLVTQRNAFLGQFNPSGHWLIIADSFAARGQTLESAMLLRSATRAHPRDYALWLALGIALTDHAGRINPAARLAFARSAALAPTSAAPGYFLGRAMLQSGDREGALRQWREILAAAPANASWRPIVEDEIANAAAR
ncbi:MAG: hypothetical protein ABIR87_01385 [Sphingomicrobium sp.]